MERACEYFRRRAGAERLHINCRTVGQVPLAWGDRVALAVVADNLLTRAVQVSKAHGTVRVQIMPEPGHVVVSVADDGPGLTEDERAALVEPIMKTAAATLGDEEARGDLGLAVAREFIRRMDGDLWTENGPDRGAIFSFRLPALE